MRRQVLIVIEPVPRAMIRLIVSLSFQDALRSEMARNYLPIYAVLISICGAAILAVAETAAGVAVGVCLGILLPAAILRGIYQLSVRSNQNPPVYVFGPEGFELKTRLAETKLSWAAIPRMDTRWGVMRVFINPVQSLPLPLRLLSDHQVRAIHAWAKAGGVKVRE